MTKGKPENGARKWTKPQVEAITPVRRTRAGFLVKPGVENIVYASS